MKKSRFLFGVVLVLSFVFCSTTWASNPQQKRDVVWRSHAHRGTGLYTQKAATAGGSVLVSVDALYYYGDMENVGFSLKHPNWDNVGWSVSASYQQPVAKIVNMRYTLAGGYLRGNNEKELVARKTWLGVRNFESLHVRGAVGVEVYPIPRAGFYVYAGLAFQYSGIYNWTIETATGDYYSSKTEADGKGTYHAFLPMIPVEIGYEFEVGKSWTVGLHVGFFQGLLDEPHWSLDAYPQTDRFGMSPYNQWADGMLQAGVSFSYRWNNCEACRLYK